MFRNLTHENLRGETWGALLKPVEFMLKSMNRPDYALSYDVNLQNWAYQLHIEGMFSRNFEESF